MNILIKIGLGIALMLPVSFVLTTVNDAYGIVEAPSSFSSLITFAHNEFVPHSPMSGEQLAAIQGMAGICMACLEETSFDTLAQVPEQKKSSSVSGGGTTVYQSNQSVGTGTVTQSNQSMITQTSSSSGQSHSNVRVQQLQTLTTNGGLATNVATTTKSSTQEFIGRILSQLQNSLQPGQSPIGENRSVGRDIPGSAQAIMNQAARNVSVNRMLINQQLNNIPHGGFLR